MAEKDNVAAEITVKDDGKSKTVVEVSDTAAVGGVVGFVLGGPIGGLFGLAGGMVYDRLKGGSSKK